MHFKAIQSKRSDSNFRGTPFFFGVFKKIILMEIPLNWKLLEDRGCVYPVNSLRCLLVHNKLYGREWGTP